MGDVITDLSRIPPDATLIFHHIPKTAGSTLDAVIEANYPVDSVFTILSPVMEGVERFRALTAEAKRRIRVIRGHGVHGLHEALEQPVVYAVLLREPVDRVLSQYFFIRGSAQHPRKEDVLSRGGTLIEYLAQGVNPQADNGQVRALSGHGGWPGPDVPFGGCTPEMLAQACRNLDSLYALVGLTECFDEFLVRARRHLGWKRIDYSRRKVTRSRPAVESLSPEELAAVRACTRLDAELYAAAAARVAGERRQEGPGLALEVAWFKWRNGASRRVLSV